MNSRVTHILDITADKPQKISDIVASCTHLSMEKRNTLEILLTKHRDVFDGKLGEFKANPASIEKIPGARTVRLRPFTITVSRKEQFKMYLVRLLKLGVLRKEKERPWGSP